MKIILFCLVLLGVAQLGLTSGTGGILIYCSGVCVYTGTLDSLTYIHYAAYYNNAEGWYDILVGTAKWDIKVSISSSYAITTEYYIKNQDGSLTQLIPSQYGAPTETRLLVPSSSDPQRKLLVKVKSGQTSYSYSYYNYIYSKFDVVSSEEVPVDSKTNDNSKTNNDSKGDDNHWAVIVTVILAVTVFLFVLSCTVLIIRHKRNQKRQRGNLGVVSPTSVPIAHQQVVQQPLQHYPNSELPYHPHQYAPVAPTYIVPNYPQPAVAPVQVAVHTAAPHDNGQATPLYSTPANPYALPPINNKRY